MFRYCFFDCTQFWLVPICSCSHLHLYDQAHLPNPLSVFKKKWHLCRDAEDQCGCSPSQQYCTTEGPAKDTAAAATWFWFFIFFQDQTSSLLRHGCSETEDERIFLCLSQWKPTIWRTSDSRSQRKAMPLDAVLRYLFRWIKLSTTQRWNANEAKWVLINKDRWHPNPRQ